MLVATFKKLVVVECALLFAQFLLGMSINLFVTIPPANPLDFVGYTGGIEVLVHVSIGLTVLAVGAGIIAAGYKLGNVLVGRLSILALAFTAWAIAAGFLFVLAGQDDSFSAAMAGGYISIYTIYFAALYKVGRKETREVNG